MEPHERLIRAREALGELVQQVADATCVNVNCYYDLEDGHDLYDALDLIELQRVLTHLRLKAEDLLATNRPHISGVKLNDFASLADAIRRHLQSHDQSLSAFEDKAGWWLSNFMNDPATGWHGWNIDCLRDVCKVLEVDWLTVLAGEFDAKPIA